LAQYLKHKKLRVLVFIIRTRSYIYFCCVKILTLYFLLLFNIHANNKPGEHTEANAVCYGNAAEPVH